MTDFEPDPARPAGVNPDGAWPDGGSPAGENGRPRRSRIVLWASLGTAAVVAALIAVLASSQPSAQVNASSPLIGKRAPAISGKSLTGAGRVTLSQFAGQWVLVNFSASWCVPCREETPQLQRFEAEHAASGGATILAVAFDEGDKTSLAAYLKSSKAEWPAIDDAQAEIEYGVTGIPESYLVDPEGTVVAKYVGGITAGEVDAFIARASSGA